MDSALLWFKLGYRRCPKCRALVHKDYLHKVKDQTAGGTPIEVCNTCFCTDCFECGKKAPTRFYYRSKFGAHFLCMWCAKLYGAVVNDG